MLCSYSQHDIAMLTSSTLEWQKKCLSNVEQSMFGSCCCSLCFISRNWYNTLALQTTRPDKKCWMAHSLPTAGVECYWLNNGICHWCKVFGLYWTILMQDAPYTSGAGFLTIRFCMIAYFGNSLFLSCTVRG